MILAKNLEEKLSIVNTAVLFEESDEIFVDFNNNPGRALRFGSADDQTIEKIYPNHLKNLKKLQHKILVTHQNPRVRIENGRLVSKFRYFLHAVEKVENSQMRFQMLLGDREQVLANYVKFYHSRANQMTLNTIFSIKEIGPQLMTYEELGTCPLVPIPEASYNLSFYKVGKKPLEILSD